VILRCETSEVNDLFTTCELVARKAGPRGRRDPAMAGIAGRTGRSSKWLDGVSEMADAMTVGLAVSQSDEDVSRDGRESASTGTAPRYSRRLSDKILIAFHHACDQGDFEIAEQLLHVLEMMFTRRPLTPDGTRRRNMESLVAAHERLWHLRHPTTDQF